MSPALDRIEGVLEGFMADALTDDYAAAPSVRGRSSGARAFAALVCILIGAILAASLMATLRSAGSRSQTRDALSQRVTSASQSLEQAQDRVDEQRDRVVALQEQLLAESNAAPGVASLVERAASATGTQPLTGRGVTVTIDDAPDAKSGSLNRVLDRDLQDLVNALWQAGASGVAINGQRLVSTTAIRAAGDAIVVNYVPLARPYVIDAVGATDAAKPESGVQQLLSHLGRDYGLVSSVDSGEVALPPGDWHDTRYAKPAQPGPSVQSTSGAAS